LRTLLVKLTELIAQAYRYQWAIYHGEDW